MKLFKPFFNALAAFSYMTLSTPDNPHIYINFKVVNLVNVAVK
jgi:hypothetical protein